MMVNHNRLLKTMEGCDGLKTGFFWAAGFSIAATAAEDGKRVIAVVLGSRSQRVRDRKAKEILTRGLQELVMNDSRDGADSDVGSRSRLDERNQTTRSATGLPELER